MRARKGGGEVCGARTSCDHQFAHVTEASQNKMAATGDDAAAMDSISKAPAAHSAALNAAGGLAGLGTPAEGSGSPLVAPKKINTNSNE